MSQNRKVGSVAIVGGTHGNELTGIHLVKHWQKKHYHADYTKLSALTSQSFQIELLLANEKAIAENRRYLDHDLNRCFKRSDLSDPDKNSVEQQIAKQINQALGPKDDPRVDFIIDLHTSTANMQTNIVLIKLDDFHLKLAAYLSSVLPDVVVTSETELMDDHHFLCSIAEKNLLIEIGPIAQGSLQADCLDNTNAALIAALDFVEMYNQNKLPDLPPTLEIMSYFSRLYFPTDEKGDICATVHPELVAKDYTRIQKGCAVFRDFDGNDIIYDGEEAHIAFVNEAAYYDQKIAMCLCRPKTYSLSSLQPVV